MLDVIFGGGTKALRETSNRIFGFVRHCGEDRKPSVRFGIGPGDDALATSRWNISVRLIQNGGQCGTVSHFTSSAVPML